MTTLTLDQNRTRSEIAREAEPTVITGEPLATETRTRSSDSEFQSLSFRFQESAEPEVCTSTQTSSGAIFHQFKVDLQKSNLPRGYTGLWQEVVADWATRMLSSGLNLAGNALQAAGEDLSEDESSSLENSEPTIAQKIGSALRVGAGAVLSAVGTGFRLLGGVTRVAGRILGGALGFPNLMDYWSGRLFHGEHKKDAQPAVRPA